jgi:hypothetical protein
MRLDDRHCHRLEVDVKTSPSRAGSRWLSAALFSLAFAVGLDAQAAVNDCDTYRRDAFCSGPGVVWCGSAARLPADRLARRAAPILWFSPDEPLLTHALPDPETGVRPPTVVRLPQKLQVVDPEHCRERDRTGCEGPADAKAAVYWRITRLLVSNGKQQAVQDALDQGDLPVADVKTLTLTYFFYYERDQGLNSHYNDLEGMEMQVDFEADAVGTKRHAMVARVTGFGHGSQLLSNILQIKKSLRHRNGAPDVTFPITVLVEEGKHASAPDRNGDGVYTPGYDVNIKVNDAWGVRDVFGSGVVASRYRESMTKPRNKDDRVGPDRTWFPEADPAPAECYLARGGLDLPENTYALEAAPECPKSDASAFCRATATLAKEKSSSKEFYEAACLGGPVERGDAAERLVGDPTQSAAATTPGVGAAKPPECKFLNMAFAQKAFTRQDKTGFRFKYLYGDSWWLQPLRFVAPSVRTEADAAGPQLTWFSPFGFPMFGGWLAARAALLRDHGEWRWSVDVSHTPSLARLADWYVGVGYDWGVSTGSADGQRFDGWAGEVGVQLRQRAFWIRGGVRLSVDDGRLSHARLVTELGYGPQPRHAKVH